MQSLVGTSEQQIHDLNNKSLDNQKIQDSRQQRNGALNRQDLSVQKQQKECFHFTVMPCYDKKLEASRKDYQDSQQQQEVDCVLTTEELQNFLQSLKIDLGAVDGIQTDSLLHEIPRLHDFLSQDQIVNMQLNTTDQSMYQEPGGSQKESRPQDFNGSQNNQQQYSQNSIKVQNGMQQQQYSIRNGANSNDGRQTQNGNPQQQQLSQSQSPQQQLSQQQLPQLLNLGSGGYADFIFRQTCINLFHIDLFSDQKLVNLPFKTRRNQSYRELILEIDGIECLKFSLMYGFKNIQNLVRQVKTGTCKYEYVEVMACPSGCLNGGGQIKQEQSISQAQTKYDLSVSNNQGFKQAQAADRQNQTFRSLEQIYHADAQNYAWDQIVDSTDTYESGVAELDLKYQTEYHTHEKSMLTTVKDW